jgi:hypothetical protein
MGHYRCDMWCNTCSNHPCTCTPKPEPVQWLVDDDDTVMTTAAFDLKYASIKTKYGPIPGSPMLRRMGMTLYPTKAAAEVAIPALLAAEIATREKDIRARQVELKKRQMKLRRLMKEQA